MYYIVGLGNTGDQYADTRHNIGRSYLEEYAANAGYEWRPSKPANALYAHALVAGESAELLLPETFMNKSGDTLAHYVEKHGVEVGDFIVLHDDVDLPIGEIKISKGRGDGGNNGIRSIVQRLGTKDFIRVRIGISPRHWWTGQTNRPRAGGPLEKFVLQKFTRKEQGAVQDAFQLVDLALQEIVKNGPEAAMNKCN